VHPTCYSYWLANSFSQFLLQDACASVDVLSLFDGLNCIALLVWLHLPPLSTMSTSIFILLTTLSARGFPLVLLTCIIELYWLVFLPCIIAFYCVFAYTPPSTVSTGLCLFSPPTCLLVIVFLLQDGRFLCLAIVYYYLHVATDIDIYCWYFVCFHNCWGQSPLPSPL